MIVPFCAADSGAGTARHAGGVVFEASLKRTGRQMTSFDSWLIIKWIIQNNINGN
jgi:hypothetical protein